MTTVVEDTSSRRPIETMTLAELRTRLDEIKRAEASLAAEKIRIVSRMHDMVHDDQPTYVVPESELISHAGLSGREARALLARTNAVEVAPVFGHLLAEGLTTAAHLDALQSGLRTAAQNQAAFLDHLPQLSDAAQSMPAGEFATLVRATAQSVVTDGGLAALDRQRRSTYLKIWNDAEGMVQLRGAFDPESGALLQGAINRRVEAMFHAGEPVDVMPWVEPNDHRRAHAVVALAARSHTAPSAIRWAATTRLSTAFRRRAHRLASFRCGSMQSSRFESLQPTGDHVRRSKGGRLDDNCRRPGTSVRSTSQAGCCRRVEPRLDPAVRLRSRPVTEPARYTSARCRTTIARFTTSTTGNPADQPIWATWFRSARGTTTQRTRAAGNSASNQTPAN